MSGNSPYRHKLIDLVMELVAKSAEFKRSLPAGLQGSLSAMVRTMNCYYSNLIEGHNTHPVEIEQALQGNYSADIKKRNLQEEAKAHIAVQEWIDQGGLQQVSFSRESLCEIHRRFCSLLPDDLRWIEDPDSQKKTRLVLGALRQLDVKVGSHISISPGAVPRFLSTNRLTIPSE